MNSDSPGNGAKDLRNWKLARSLSLSAWDLERSRQRWPDSDRARLVALRARKGLQAAMERELGIAKSDRAMLKMRENASASCLLIHGRSHSPAELKALAEYLYQNNLNVYATLLPGPDTGGDRISIGMWRSHLAQLRRDFQALRRATDRVHVVGHDLGAALAVLLARKEAVSSLALLAPSLVFRVPLLERIRLWFRWNVIPWPRSGVDRDLENLECMDKARANLSRVKAPIYAAQCEDDELASPVSLRILQKKSRHSACRFQVFPTGGNAILQAHGESTLHREILRFFRAGR